MNGRSQRRSWLPIILVLLLAVAGGFLCCPPSLFHSRFPGHSYLMEKPRFLSAVSYKTGRLAVGLQHRGEVHIWVSQDSSKFTPVTSGILDADPAWDPTGTRLAYVSLGRHSRLALRTHDLKNASDSMVVEQPLISQPRWSHDGATIFFLRTRPDVTDHSTVCAIDLRTKRLSALAETPYNRTQAWDLLKEDQIAYSHDGAVWIKAPGRPAHCLPDIFTAPCMVSASPDNRLLFVCDSLAASDKLAILVDLQSLQMKQIYRGYIRYAVWSPSGQYLAIAGEHETVLLRTYSTDIPTDGWQLISTLKGIAACWRSEHKLVFIRPERGSPYFLEEVDVESMSSTRLASEVGQS